MPSTSGSTNSLSQSASKAAGAAETASSSDRTAEQQAAEGTASAEVKIHHHSHGSFWDQLINIAGNNKINSLSDLLNSTAAVEHMIEHNAIPL